MLFSEELSKGNIYFKSFEQLFSVWIEKKQFKVDITISKHISKQRNEVVQ